MLSIVFDRARTVGDWSDDDGAWFVSFETCFNFRDVGGYDTIDGQRVRGGAVFRSDSLHRLTDPDLDMALGMGLRTVIDLRSTAELERHGRTTLADEVSYHHTPVFEEDALPFAPARPHDPAPPPGESYVATATAGSAAIAAALRIIAECEHAVVFHCSAGKDRTGLLTALMLSSLGVPDESIVADYHLSERALAPTLAWAEANDPELAAQMAALPEWLRRSPMAVMQAFLDHLRDQHGSITDFLLDIGVEPQILDALRFRLLQR